MTFDVNKLNLKRLIIIFMLQLFCSSRIIRSNTDDSSKTTTLCLWLKIMRLIFVWAPSFNYSGPKINNTSKVVPGMCIQRASTLRSKVLLL